LFACFEVMLVTWMSFASSVRELRRDALSMLETHIMVSSLIFCIVLILVFHLVLTLMLRLTLLVFCLVSLMGLTITHMVLVHERTILCLDPLVTAYVLIVVLVPRIGTVLPLEVPILTLSRVALTVHVFSIVVHVPLGQMVRC
jgi:hypothetical protein